MKKMIMLIVMALVMVSVMVIAGPERTPSSEGKKQLDIIDQDTADYANLATAIRNAKNFSELQTVMATWADGESQKAKDKKKVKVK